MTRIKKLVEAHNKLQSALDKKAVAEFELRKIIDESKVFLNLDGKMVGKSKLINEFKKKIGEETIKT